MDSKGFFESLFDFSFTSFITTRIISVVYGLLIAAGALAALSIIIGALQSGALPILLAIIAAPFVFLLYVVIARVYCEVIIVLFKIADNTAILAGRPEQPPAPPAV